MDVNALIARLSDLPQPMRRIAVAAVAAVVLASIASSILLHPQRVPLFAGALHPEQLSEVEERLAAWNVPFTPAADNVTVDAKRRGDLLLRLSMAGVPHGHIDGTGDLLAKVGALTPQAVVDAQTRDGLAGDIELGLRGIDGVQDARVIVAPAKEAYFAGETSRDASASVRLTIVAGTRLSSQAVNGIRAFVAASVPGLDAARVTIVDDRGIALGEGGTADDAADLQRSLQSALDGAIGAGSTIVRVRIEYDARSITSTNVRRAAGSALPIASQTQEERYDGAGKRYDRSDQQLDRGSETREVTASAQPGRVARISAAVFVDAAHAGEIVQVRSLAAAALGIDPHRGDALDVEAVNFSRAPQARKDGWWLAYGAIVPLLPTLAIAVAALAALRAARPALEQLVRSMSERSTIARTASGVQGIAPANVRATLAGEPPHTAAAIISALPAATAAAVLDMYPEHERSAIVRRMQRPASPLFSDVERYIANA